MITSDQQTVSVTATEIGKLLNRFAEAQRLSDLDALSELLTDDFKLVGPLGFVVPKQQWLEQFRSGALQIESLEWDDVDIRTHAYANSAIAIGRLTQTATYADNRVDGAFRVTAIDRLRSDLAPGGSSLQPDRGPWPPALGARSSRAAQ
jgi:ketosteroid isomerase-like protein